MEELLARLNERQREAVVYDGGPLLILAGAGSGKTRVLTQRIAWSIHTGKARPWEILAVTFTNKAAAEMKARIAALLGGEADGMWVSTFHSACLRILRRHIDRLGYSTAFAIYDDGDQQRLIKQVCKDLKLPSTVNPRGISARIDQAKNRLLAPEDLDKRLGGRDGVPYGQVYVAYQEALRRNDALDFNDLIGLAIQLFEEHPDVLERYRATFRHLLVDEYQDTNHAQYRLVTLLGRRGDPGKEQVAVVGDDDQSIYSFRGADIRNILDFERDFPGAKVVRLEQNYRSTQAILEAATAVVARNRDRKGKTLWTAQAGGAPIELRSAYDETDEARRVVEAVRELSATGYRLHQIAVFYRTNGQSRVLEEAFSLSRIPFHIVGGQRFYDRKEIKDVMSWLRLIANPADDVAFERAVAEPPRGVGAATVDKLRDRARDLGLPLLKTVRRLVELGEVRTAPGKKLAEFAERVGTLESFALRLSFPDLLREVLARSGYVDRLREEDTHEAHQRLENLDELLNQAAMEFAHLPPPEGLRAFLDRTALVADSDSLAPQDGTDEAGARDRVTLMTVHTSKGLEYPAVLIAGMDERLFPHARSYDDPKAMEEERRLCYVAFTRAMERLLLFHARRRVVAGERTEGMPSRFLREIPPGLLLTERAGFASSPASPSPRRPEGEWIDYDETQEDMPRAAGSPGTLRPASVSAPYPSARPVVRRPAGIVRREGSSPAAREEPRVVRDDEGTFEIGQRVRHPKFGVGEVRRVEGPPHNVKLTIHFRDAGPKEILVRYVELEILPP